LQHGEQISKQSQQKSQQGEQLKMTKMPQVGLKLQRLVQVVSSEAVQMQRLQAITQAANPSTHLRRK
jgi:hypothetical protein